MHWNFFGTIRYHLKYLFLFGVGPLRRDVEVAHSIAA